VWRDPVVRVIGTCWDHDPKKRSTCAQVLKWMDSAAACVVPATFVQRALDTASQGYTIAVMVDILQTQPLFRSAQVQLLALFLYSPSAPNADAYATQWFLPKIAVRSRNY
jgi:hypothetical protein